MGRGNLKVVQDGSENDPGSPKRVERPSGRSRTGRGMLPEVLNGSGNPWGGPGDPRGDP